MTTRPVHVRRHLLRTALAACGALTAWTPLAGAQGAPAPGITAQAAYEYVQAERARAELRWRERDSAGIAMLEALQRYLQRPDIRDLANGYPFLANRRTNIALDLARATHLRGNRVVAARWLSTALSDPLFGDPAFVSRDSLLQPLLGDSAVARAIDGARRRETRRLGRTLRSSSFDVDDRAAALSLVWSEVRHSYPDLDRGAIPVWDSLYRATIPRVRDAASPWLAWRELQRFVARVEDGHTNVYPPDSLVARHWVRPPIVTRRIDGRVVVTDVPSASLRALGVTAGAVVDSIDGEAVEPYVARVIAPFESASTPQDLAVRAYGYAMLRGPVDRPVVLSLTAPDGARRRVVVPRTRPSDVVAGAVVRDTIFPDGIGYLRVDDFGADSIPRLLRAAVRRLAGARALVVDVRNNGGGNTSAGFPILQALAERPFPLSTQWVLASSGFWRVRGFNGVPMHLPSGMVAPDSTTRIRGPVALLIGPATFSAAEDFAVAWRSIGRGPLIGEATGGSTGQPYSFDLPGGGSARVRTKHDAAPDGTEFDAIGVRPDVEVRRTLAGVRAGRDEVLDEARRRLGGGTR